MKGGTGSSYSLRGRRAGGGIRWSLFPSVGLLFLLLRGHISGKMGVRALWILYQLTINTGHVTPHSSKSNNL